MPISSVHLKNKMISHNLDAQPLPAHEITSRSC